MNSTLQFRFSYTFSGIVWNTFAVPKQNILIIEVRDEKKFKTQFFAFDHQKNEFLWKDLSLDEDWWLGLTAVNEQVILFHTYTSKGNPDHKNLIAFNIFKEKFLWEIKDFSFCDWNQSKIWGFDTNDELVKNTINIETGVVKEEIWDVQPTINQVDSIRPALYLEGSPDFETVRQFLDRNTENIISRGVEYLEWRKWIIISAYVEKQNVLANYLIVLNDEGKILLEEKLGENLGGIGTDTFFILEGCLFLVKNKSELVVYTLYD